MIKYPLISFLIFSCIFSFGQEKLQYKIGDGAQGGIVFWVDESGYRGLVCALSNQGLNIPWDTEIDFKGGVELTPERDTKSIAIADGIYAGVQNTKDIIKFVGRSDKPFAALICDELVVNDDSVSYDDWYLPSQEELNLMFLNRIKINESLEKKGGETLDGKTYWSSTDVNCNEKPYVLYDKVHIAWGHNFKLGGKKYQLPSRKYMPYAVRAIRAF